MVIMSLPADTSDSSTSSRQQQQARSVVFRDAKDLPYHLFDTVVTHPALSIPAVRTSELRRVLEPLLHTASSSSSPGSDNNNNSSSSSSSSSSNVGKSKKNRGRGQPFIVKQEDDDEEIEGDDDRSKSRRRAQRRLLVLRMDYDKKSQNEDEEGPCKEGSGSAAKEETARRALSEILQKHPRSPSSGVGPVEDGIGTRTAAVDARAKANTNAIYLTTYDVRTDYRGLSASQVLRRLLLHDGAAQPRTNESSNGIKPGNGDAYDCETERERDEGAAASEIPTRFETAGHVAHVNLRDEWLPYKYWIGKVLLDKNAPGIRTVVNKVGSIENEYRVLDCEVIAGDNRPGWSLVTVKEEGCAFELDFQKVYWNSRLAGEHRRLVEMIRHQARERRKESDGPLIVADLMAGVGPFAVPLTCSRITTNRGEDAAAMGRPANIVVHANDLNPDSYRFLVRNGRSNRCRNLHCYNQDARDFVCNVVEPRGTHVVIMNLPASAPEFLDAFRGYGSGDKAPDGDPQLLPVMYVYCFAPKDEEAAGYPSALERCQSALACEILSGATVRTVRNVSPRNNMVCVQFRLPREARDTRRTQPRDGESNIKNTQSGSAPLDAILRRQESATESREAAEKMSEPASKRNKTS
jgi:tRNA (guanine37-N1)-methyltransferase